MSWTEEVSIAIIRPTGVTTRWPILFLGNWRDLNMPLDDRFSAYCFWESFLVPKESNSGVILSASVFAELTEFESALFAAAVRR